MLEEKEEERRVKELRKSMEFKASPLPDLKSRKFSPKNLHYLEPPKPGTVPNPGAREAEGGGQGRGQAGGGGEAAAERRRRQQS